jgi:hypothetical protein
MSRRPGQLTYLSAVVLLLCSLAAQQIPSHPSSSAPKKPSNSSRTQATTPDPGAITGGVYRNSFFGFTYKLPFGWVDRTGDMREDADQPAQSAEHAEHAAESAKSLVLLAVFERPPEATGDTVNSAVVIAAEPSSSYPGLKNAENYFDPLTELAQSKSLKVVNEPYEYRVGSHALMRGDFSKELGKLIMYQSSLVMLEKSYAVSFTFIGGSDDEVEELLKGLSFGKQEATAVHK